VSIAFSSQTSQGYTLSGTALGTLSYLAAYSIAGWIYVTDTTKTQTVFSLNDNADNAVGVAGTPNRDTLTLLTRANAAAMDLRMIVAGTGSSLITSTTATLPIKVNTWHHIAVVRTTSLGVTVYVDGLSVRSATMTLTTVRTIAPKRLDIGRDPSLGAGLLGRIAHIKIWTRALSSSQIIREVWCIKPFLTSSVLAWYPTILNAGAARGNDSSANARHFTLSSIGGVTTPAPTDSTNPPNVGTVMAPMTRPTGTLRSSATAHRSIRRSLSGALTFTGDGVRSWSKVFVRTLAFGGDLTKSYIRLLLATLGFSHTFDRQRLRLLQFVATLAFTVSHPRRINRLLTRTLGFSSVFTPIKDRVLRFVRTLRLTGDGRRTILRRLTGSLGFNGVFTKLKANVLVFVRTLRMGGEARRSLIKRMAGSLGFSHRLLFGRFKILAATLRFDGNARRSYLKLLAASLGLSGVSQRSMVRRLTGSLSFFGEMPIIKKGLILLSRTLHMGGDMRRGMFRRLTATLGMGGSFLRSRTILLVGRLGFIGRSGRGLLRLLGGSLSFRGDFGRGLIMIFRRTLSFNGRLTYFSAKNLIIQQIRLLGSWLSSTRLLGYWKTDHDLDGEIDE
jgi:Concanavalin A-like lectin/glucanases superfamily